MIKKLLRRKVKGATTVEFVLLSPLMFFTFIVCLYFLICCLSYIYFSNTANKVAKDLNMRQSGYLSTQQKEDPIISYSLWADGVYQDAKNYNPDNPNEIYKFIKIESGDHIEKAKISISTGNNILRRSANYIIQNNAEGFFMPGAKVKEIQVKAFKNGIEHSFSRDNMNASMSNTVIMVSVKYTCFGIPLQVNGYNIIT